MNEKTKKTDYHQVTLSLDKEVYKKIRDMAAAEDRSFAAQVRKMLREATQ